MILARPRARANQRKMIDIVKPCFFPCRGFFAIAICMGHGHGHTYILHGHGFDARDGWPLHWPEKPHVFHISIQKSCSSSPLQYLL